MHKEEGGGGRGEMFDKKGGDIRGAKVNSAGILRQFSA